MGFLGPTLGDLKGLSWRSIPPFPTKNLRTRESEPLGILLFGPAVALFTEALRALSAKPSFGKPLNPKPKSPI